MSVLPWRRPEPQSAAEPHTPCSEPCPRCGHDQAVEAAVDALLEHWQSVATEPPGEYVSDLAASARH
jgi:hypothetical protein